MPDMPRRQFLCTPAAFACASLLQGCGGGGDENAADIPVLLKNVRDAETDIMNVIRATTIFLLGQVPAVGGLISAVVGIFWAPYSNDNPWDDIKDQVNKLVDEKISEEAYHNLSLDLAGLGNALKAYLDTVKSGSREATVAAFQACHIVFESSRPKFQDAQREALFLPLFVHFGTLHLTLLRDGVLGGPAMSWNGRDIAAYRDIAVARVKEYGAYVDRVYADILKDAEKKAAAVTDDHHFTEQFRIVNACHRNYQLAVLDFRTLYPYLDPAAYPGKVQVELRRVVYSDPLGTNDDAGRSVFIDVAQRTATMQPPTRFELYSGGLPFGDVYYGGVVGFATYYSPGKGPDGKDSDIHDRGNPKDGRDVVDCTTARGPVTAVETIPNTPSFQPSIVYCLRMVHKDGSRSHMAGGFAGDRPPNGTISYGGHILVDISFQSNSWYYGALGCIVFGFQLENMGRNIDGRFFQKLRYIVSIADMPLPADGDLQKSGPSGPGEAEQRQWQRDRQQFWLECRKARLASGA